VGKTTVAAACGVQASDRGLRTLLVSTDPAHSTSDILEAALNDAPRCVTGTLWAMEIDPERERDRYVAEVKSRVAEATSPALLAEVERQIDLAAVSPGAEEAALFERFTRILDDQLGEYDRILFDTAPTGQTLRLLSLPELMTAWMSGLIGRRRQMNLARRMWQTVTGSAGASPDDPVLTALEARRDRFRRARRLLTDAERTAFMFVLVPERLPILETEKAVAALEKYGIPVGGIIVNRVLPQHADGAFLAQRRAREAEYVAWIERSFGHRATYRVPLLEGDVVGVSALRQVAAALSAP
jgi:arsenite-transporting ATPase